MIIKKCLLLFLLVAVLRPAPVWPQLKQHAVIKGQLKDKDTQQPLPDASIVLLHVRDSSSVMAALTGKEGIFILEGVPVGEYRLYISYLGYQSFWYTIKITADIKLINLSTIHLQKTGLTLAEMEIVKTRYPMAVRKDTIEFNADFFKTRENAVMEELLKKLPGVQVEKDGTIKVHGEIVKRVLIDGRRFFGDDPKITTRSLTADMVDKVQIIDSRSDQAQFNGISGDKTEKTINIRIKEDWKQHFSGNVAAGYGTEERFAIKGNLNRLGDKQQLSVIGDGDNLNSYLDRDGRDNVADGSGGVTHNWRLGTNYSENFDKKLDINGSYLVTDSRSERLRKSVRQNLLPDTTYYYQQHAHALDNRTNHLVNMRMNYNIDTMHVLAIGASFQSGTRNSQQDDLYETRGGDEKLVNSGTVHNISGSSNPMFATNVFLGKRFKKPGRRVSIVLNMAYDNINEEQLNKSYNLFMQSNGAINMDTIDQHVDINSRQRQLLLSLFYTEPVFKGYFLDVTYEYTHNYTISDKFTNNYNSLDKVYDLFDESLSNSFKNITSLQTTGLYIHTQKLHYDYGIGLNVLLNKLNNDNINQDKRFQQHVIKVFPSLSFNYAFAKNKRLRFLYSGTVEPPSPVQLQPVMDNTNPLYIQSGNPDLKPASLHNLILGYNSLGTATGSIFAIDVRATFIKDRIINSSQFNSSGRQVSQPLNANGAYSTGINMTNSFLLNNQQTTVSSNTSVVFNHDITYINGIKGDIGNFNVKQNLRFNYTHKELFDFAAEAGINYNSIRYSIQKDNNANFFNYIFSFDSNINLPLGFIIGTDLYYARSTGRAKGYNLDVVLLNAFISKSLFKRKQGLIKLQGFDLLKQNVSINRTVQENYIEDVQANVLQRFFMLSFSYFIKNRE